MGVGTDQQHSWERQTITQMCRGGFIGEFVLVLVWLVLTCRNLGMFLITFDSTFTSHIKNGNHYTSLVIWSCQRDWWFLRVKYMEASLRVMVSILQKSVYCRKQIVTVLLKWHAHTSTVLDQIISHQCLKTFGVSQVSYEQGCFPHLRLFLTS